MSPLYEEALTAQEKGSIEQAEQLFLKVIALAQDNEDFEQQQRCFVQLSAIAREKKDMHAVLRWLKKNYNLTKKHNSRQASRICLELAFVFLDRNEHSESKLWAKKALDRSEEDWDKEVMAESQLLLGMCLFREERPEDARILFRRSNVIYEELKNEEGIYKSLFHMGLVCHQMSDFARARGIFLGCLEQAPEEAVPLVADLHLRLTVISMELEYYIDALFHALASLGRYRRLGSDRQDRVWKEIFRIRGFLSEEEFVDQIQSHLNEEGYQKFKAMSEAVEMRFQNEIEKARAEKDAQEQKRLQAQKETERREAFRVEQRKREAEQRAAEDTTAPITRDHSLRATEEDYGVTNVPTPSSYQESVPVEPPVVELEVFQEEVQEDSAESEMTWREEPMTSEPEQQTKNIILLFFGVFLFVFGSLYVLSLLQ
jgi:hypothetical protein